MVDPLPCEALRWRCDATKLGFRTTADLDPIRGVIGQDNAVESLRFGLETDAAGQNIFIRGLAGTGRLTMVRRLLEELKPVCLTRKDCCYVHNFSQPDRPRLVTLKPGQARAFRRAVHGLADFIRDGLSDSLATEGLRARKAALDRRTEREIEGITKPFEEALRAADLALVSLQMGPIAQAAIFPVVEGKPVAPEEMESLKAAGRVTPAQEAQFLERRDAFRKQLEEVTDGVRRLKRDHGRETSAVLEEAARALLAAQVLPMLAEFRGEAVSRFLGEIVDDVVQNHLDGGMGKGDFTQLYRVNVVLESPPGQDCPMVIENHPSLANLLGSVEREWSPRGPGASDFSMVRAGSLLRADGGYLILEARDLLSEPGAWKVLVRTLRTGMLEIVPGEFQLPWIAPSLKPEPIPIRVKVILLGDASLYGLLDANDPDFPNLFKVLADFDTEIERSPESFAQYAGVMARIIAEENLPAFDREAVAALIDHGARVAGRRHRLTTRFGRIADIAREAAWLARRRGPGPVGHEDVREAVRRGRRRADLPSRHFRELLKEGTIRVDTKGAVVGQINGLAVVHAGPLTYGFPARITATIGAGTAGVINIEREAALSGSIHTKGFYILGGLLRHLLSTDHPLAFSASIAFEQSYGGIDGDSASGAEMCCLLSALTGFPIRQDLAMTGAIDQRGNILAVGAVNEKVDGFFDTCADLGLTGSQGVLIPGTNAGDLMLRSDVVAACRAGRFHVYAVDTIEEALEVLTGAPAGRRGGDGIYPEGTLLRQAVDKAFEYWVKVARSPSMESEEGGGGEPEEVEDES
ncbi:MAG: Lon protease family protein [Planctomycetaceae bacterium]